LSTPTVRVVTLNCRNTADRWRMRRTLLLRQLVDLQPEVVGLQEVHPAPRPPAAVGPRGRARHRAGPDAPDPTAGGRILLSSDPGMVMDYIFVNDLVDVHDARVVFDEVDAGRPALAASDHYGLAATVSIRPAAGPASGPAVSSLP
jgi:endonuclease/exonuclease/phosphatase family metal-dependent hydrolase